MSYKEKLNSLSEGMEGDWSVWLSWKNMKREKEEEQAIVFATDKRDAIERAVDELNPQRPYKVEEVKLVKRYKKENFSKKLNSLSEGVTPEYRAAQDIYQKFNRQRKGVEIFPMNYTPYEIVEFGVNIASRGTENVSTTKQRVKDIQEAIKICEDLNRKKIMEYEK